MGKKNPFVMTVGFNKNNPEHVKVAEFLNSLGRTKGQYIVKAVTMYQRCLEGEHENVQGTVDYEQIREYIIKVISELRVTEYELTKKSLMTNVSKQFAENQTETLMIEDDMANCILRALDEFDAL